MSNLPIKPKKIYRTRMRRADGSVAEYHNAERGGSRILGHTDPLAALAYLEAHRAHLIWTEAEIDQFVAGVPAYVGRILVAAVETGFRSGELQVFSRKDIQTTDRDRGRIVLRTGTGRGPKYRGVPLTPRLARLVAELPADQEQIIVNARGKPFAQTDTLGQLVSQWQRKVGIRKELRLHHARGTTVTRLVRAGCSVIEIAAHMGWSVQHATEMLVRHAAHDPDMTDAILKNIKLRGWKR